MTTILPVITVTEFEGCNLEITFKLSPLISFIGLKPFKVTDEHFVYFCNPVHTFRYPGGVVIAYCAYYLKSELPNDNSHPSHV